MSGRKIIGVVVALLAGCLAACTESTTPAKPGKMFDVTVLKTDGFLPHTRVFLELDRGYWYAGKEGRQRAVQS